MFRCDERLPSCFNCARRGMACSLTSSEQSPQNIEPAGQTGIDITETYPTLDALPVAGIWSPPLPGASLDFQDHGLELMHHYSTITANTLALKLDMQHVWRMVLPEMSYNAPFLSHGLLSVAALHKAHLLPERRDKYLDLAAYHQTRGMGSMAYSLASADRTGTLRSASHLQSLLGAGRNLTQTPFSAWANGIWIVGENDEASYEYVVSLYPTD
ncbi:sterol uptake control 2 [Fusarium coicis]|nr:sterol uptake control 2 [Fusarium coicis]